MYILYIYIYNIHKSKICKFIYNGILKCPHGSMSLSGTIYVAYHCTDLEQFLFRILCTSHVILILFTIAFVSFWFRQTDTAYNRWTLSIWQHYFWSLWLFLYLSCYRHIKYIVALSPKFDHDRVILVLHQAFLLASGMLYALSIA